MANITILQTSDHKPLAKKYWIFRGGTLTVSNYQNASEFRWQEQEVANIRQLSKFLLQLQKHRDACIIRGAPAEGLPEVATRKGENFPEPQDGCSWVMLDIDGVEAPEGINTCSHEAAEYIVTKLPAEFHDVTYVAMLSNSAGVRKPDGELLKSGIRVHLFFLLAQAVPGKRLAAWLESHCYDTGFYRAGLNKGNNPMLYPGVDMSLIRTCVQPHYTAAPILGRGVACDVSPENRLWLKQKTADFVKLPQIDPVLEHEVSDRRNALRLSWARENGYRLEKRRVNTGHGTYASERLVPMDPAEIPIGRELIRTDLRANGNVLGLVLADEKTPKSWYVVKSRPWLARRMGDEMEIPLEEFCPAALTEVQRLGWIQEITTAPEEGDPENGDTAGTLVSTLSEPASGLEPGAAESRINQVVKIANGRFGLYAANGRLGVIRENKDKTKDFIGYFGLMYVYAYARTLGDSDWLYVIHALNQIGQWKELRIPRETLFERNELLRLLGREGIYANPGRNDALVMYLQDFPCQRTFLSVDRIGWDATVEKFILPEKVITKPEHGSEEEVIVSSIAQHYIAGIKCSEWLVDWQKQVALPCLGNSRLELGIFCALLPPMLRGLRLHNFGVHFFGNSSLGKSTIMQVAASVWGDPARICHHWHATDNALEGLAYCHNDALLILNEVGQGDKSKVGGMIYMLGNGEGKARARINGQIRPSKTWLLGVLSTGEKTMAEHIRESGQRVMAGQTVRMVDVSVEMQQGRGVVENLNGFPDSGTLVKALEQATMRFHGTASETFIEALVREKDSQGFVDNFHAFREEFHNALPSAERSPEVLRVIAHFCHMAFAGEFAISHGILPYPSGTAFQTTLRIVAEYEASRGGAEGFDILEAIRNLRRQLSEHRYRNFVRMSPNGQRFAYDYSTGPQIFWGYAVHTDQESGEFVEFKIPIHTFKEEFCRGVNADAVVRALEARGHLRRDGKQYGRNRDHCYSIPYRFLHGEDGGADGEVEEDNTAQETQAPSKSLPCDIDG